MHIDIRLNHIDKVEGLEDKLKEKVGRFVKNDKDAILVVRAHKTAERTELRSPTFGCEMVLRTSRPSGTFVVMKESENFYEAFDAASMALSKILRRRSASEARHDRTQIRNFKEKANSNFEDLSLEGASWNKFDKTAN